MRHDTKADDASGFWRYADHSALARRRTSHRIAVEDARQAIRDGSERA